MCYITSLMIVKDMGQSAPAVQSMDVWQWETKTEWGISGLETSERQISKSKWQSHGGRENLAGLEDWQGR